MKILVFYAEYLLHFQVIFFISSLNKESISFDIHNVKFGHLNFMAYCKNIQIQYVFEYIWERVWQVIRHAYRSW